MKTTFIYLVLFVTILLSCSSSSENTTTEINANLDGWIVASSDLRGGGETFGLNNTPLFKTVGATTALKDTSMVAMVSFNNEVRVYPYHYTNFYEIVNDVFDQKNIAVSYCPITKSAICFDRTIDNTTYELVASGFLYKYNMVPSDKDLDFFYSQMLMSGIKGEYANTMLDQYNLIETNWKTVKDFFPNAMVYWHNETRNEKKAGNDDDPIKPVGDGDFFYGILNAVKGQLATDLYAYEDFPEPIRGVTKIINERSAIVIGSESKQIFATYYVPTNNTLSLMDDSNFPNIIEDNLGNIYSIFGYAVSGPDQGSQLESPRSFVAQHWAWADFYPILRYQ